MTFTFALERVLLTDEFNNASIEGYLHHIAKHVFKPELYGGEKIVSVVLKVIQKIGNDCFNKKKSKLELTPLQVAYIYQNTAGINFFSTRSAEQTLDLLNRSNLDYRTIKTTKTIFPLHKLLSPPSFTYKKGTNDWGKEITEIVISGLGRQWTNPSMLPIKHVIEGLGTYCQQLGIKINQMSEYTFPRDWAIFDGTGKLLVLGSKSIERSQKIMHIANFNHLITGECQNHHVEHETGRFNLPGQSMLMYERNANPTNVLKNPKSTSIPFAEGGNYFICTNTKGEKQVLLGSLHFSQLLIELEEINWFKESKTPRSSKPLEDVELEKVAQEMYRLGLLDFRGHRSSDNTLEKCREIIEEWSMFKAKSPYTCDLSFGDVAKKHQLITEPTFEKEELQKLRPQLEDFQWKKEALREYLSVELNIAKESIHSIPALQPHLDFCLLPGPKGTIFLNSFKACAEIFGSLKVDTEEDHQFMAGYKMMSQYLHLKTKERFDEVTKVLTNAGFKVIPAPGHFFLPREIKVNGTANFMNALTGWSNITKKYFCITTGITLLTTSIGEKIMNLFERFLKSHQPDLDVFFVGSPSFSPDEFISTPDLWSSHGLENPMGSVHCLTLETDSEDHTEK